MQRCIVVVHSNRRTSGRHSHEGYGEDHVCLLQREDGDDQESILVAGMDRIKIQRELDRKSTRLNSSHLTASRMPSSA